MPGGIPLKQLIEQLRREVTEAVEAGQGKEHQFHLEAIDLEVQVVAQRSEEGSGGIKLWGLVEGGLKGSETHGTTHRVCLKLRPYNPGNPEGKALVNDVRSVEDDDD